MPENELVLGYLKDSRERIELEEELKRQESTGIDIPLIIGGKEIRREIPEKLQCLITTLIYLQHIIRQVKRR